MHVAPVASSSRPVAQTAAPAPLAGMARLSEIARHWKVSPATAKAILRAAGIKRLPRGRGFYAWASIWRLEGAGQVEPADFEAYREALLDKKALAGRYGISERTARRWLAENQVPAIRLSPRILRARRIDLDRDDDAPPRRRGADRSGGALICPDRIDGDDQCCSVAMALGEDFGPHLQLSSPKGKNMFKNTYRIF